ncbi:putative cross-wall-targeting lipoprotein signal domain-containing proteiin, partial [Streptococcus suis]
MNQTRVNGYGFFRKSKAYGLVCGIGLVVGALITTFGMSHVALAEEVAPAPATTVEASVESVSVESVTAGTISTTTEANDVSNQAQVTGDISLSDVNSGFSNDSLTVDTTIVGSVS